MPCWGAGDCLLSIHPVSRCRILVFLASACVTLAACPENCCSYTKCASCISAPFCYWYPNAVGQPKCAAYANAYPEFPPAMGLSCNDGCPPATESAGATSCALCTDQSHCLPHGCSWNASASPQCYSPCTGSSTSLAAPQCKAWIELFDATNGTGWAFCSGSRLDPCGCTALFPGVGRRVLCSADKKSLVWLLLNNANLKGTLPLSFSRLSALTAVWMYDNPGLGGTIPALDKMTALQVLEMYSNPRLRGTIPPLSALTALKYLYLYNNTGLRGKIPALQKMTALIGLQIGNNPGLNGTVPFLGNLTKLRFLFLQYNTGLRGTFPSLQRLTGLQQLVMPGTAGLRGGIPEFGMLTALQSVALFSNPGMTGTLPDLKRLTALQELIMYGNPGLRGTIPPVGNLTMLRSLDMHNCSGLSGSLPRGIATLTALRLLMLSNSNMSGAVPADLPAAQYIDEAGMSSCGLGGNNFHCPVPQSIVKQCLVTSLHYELPVCAPHHGNCTEFQVIGRGPSSEALGCNCPIGTYSRGSAKACLACSSNMYSTGGDALSCMPCPASSNITSSTVRQLCVCPAGTARTSAGESCVATAALIYHGLETPDVVALLAVATLLLAACDYFWWQKPLGQRLSVARRSVSRRRLRGHFLESSNGLHANKSTTNVTAVSTAAVTETEIEMTPNPGAPRTARGTSVGRTSCDVGSGSSAGTQAMEYSLLSLDQGGSSTGGRKGVTDEQKRKVALFVAAIDFLNFISINIDFTVFASQTVVAPVARLVLALFWVKVGIAIVVFVAAQATMSSSWSVAGCIIRAFSCGGSRYDVSAEMHSTRCGPLFHTMVLEEAKDFARSLRFNTAVGSLTFGILYLQDRKACTQERNASLDFERLNDRPYGIASILNALAVVKALFAVYVNTRILQLRLLQHGSNEYIFVVFSLALGMVRLGTTVLVGVFIALSRAARRYASQQRQLRRLQDVINGVYIDAGTLVRHLEKPVRASVNVYDRAHSASLRGLSELPTLLKTHFVPGKSDDDETQPDGLIVRHFRQSSVLVQDIPANLSTDSTEYVNWLYKCAEQAQEMLKAKLVPGYPGEIEWRPKQKKVAYGSVLETGILDKDPPARVFKVCDPGLKGRERAAEKSRIKYRDGGGHVHHEKLCDLSRLSLIFDSYDDMQAMLNEMLSSAMFGGNVVRVENRYFNPTVLGWRDVQILVRVPLPDKHIGGDAVHHICEVQLQHKMLADARKEAHTHYTQIRTRLALSLPAKEHDNAQACVLGRLSRSEVDENGAGTPTLADVLFKCIR